MNQLLLNFDTNLVIIAKLSVSLQMQLQQLLLFRQYGNWKVIWHGQNSFTP